MPAFQVTFEMKKMFFDRAKVIKQVDRQKRRAISRSLSFVRTRARSLLGRVKKKVSRPGKPPSVHTSGISLKTILFAYDPAIQGGVVGPVFFNQAKGRQGYASTVPQLMEFGGTANITEVQSNSDGKFYRESTRIKRRSGQKRRRRQAVYKARPFMQTALQIEQDAGNILSPWANVVGN